ncbi:hypothetical protein [Corallococcus exiguus]|uniref:hypothetical protein n=1 Tax=Corallococcus exiguus TaxID=83462 RepID=UPI003DA351FA
MLLDALHDPEPHVESVTVLDCVPVVSQKSLKPPQLPQPPELVPHELPFVLREHACDSEPAEEPHVPLEQVYEVTERDCVPVWSQVLL